MAIQAADIDHLGCTDRVAATGAEILPGTGGFGRRRCKCSAVSAGAGDLKAGELVAVNQDIG